MLLGMLKNKKMSFIQSQNRCESCGYTMNVAFGIVGTTMIADGGPDKCPECKVGEVRYFCAGWSGKNPRYIKNLEYQKMVLQRRKAYLKEFLKTFAPSHKKYANHLSLRSHYWNKIWSKHEMI